MTTDEYNKLLSGIDSKHQYIFGFCYELPYVNISDGALRSDYNPEPLALIFGYTRCVKLFYGLDQNEVIGQVITYIEDFTNNIIGQIIDNYMSIVYGILVGIGLIIVYLIFMRFMIGVVIWTSIIGVILLFAGIGSYCIY